MTPIRILPYSAIVEQNDLREALEVGYVSRSGVLATGPRGTAKSTTIRAFAMLVYQKLPVTMPLGVTDDRVLGGQDVEALLGDKPEYLWNKGLLEQAGASGMLYIDEINLLEDHIVNLVLDTAGMGILTVQRENSERPVMGLEFALVGSMNPDEGALRPQLLDRFGMVVPVPDNGDLATRKDILRILLDWERYRDDPESAFMVKARTADQAKREELRLAYERFPGVGYDSSLVDACAVVADEFGIVGHRGELTMANAARACAALAGEDTATAAHLRPSVAKPVLIHRRSNAYSGTLREWGTAEDERLARALASVQG